jgi:hypothetical protein
MYQHTDKTGRLWEISVLTRDDLADYVSRMADAVGILARVEDRSELDVYEDLRVLGVKMEPGAAKSPEQTPDVDDTTRAVHDRIRKWLGEEGCHIQEIPNPTAMLNIVVTLQNGQGLRILQSKDHADRITIAKQLRLGSAFREELLELPVVDRREMLWEIRRDCTILGIDLEGLEFPTESIWHIVCVYFDGLTKDVLFQRILQVLRALALSINALIRGFERAERPESAEKLRHLVPNDASGIGRSLAAAG